MDPNKHIGCNSHTLVCRSHVHIILLRLLLVKLVLVDLEMLLGKLLLVKLSCLHFLSFGSHFKELALPLLFYFY